MPAPSSAPNTPAPRSNFAATAAPAGTDDASAGYSIGSTWLIPTTGDMWRLRDASAGAAKWVRYAPADFYGYVAGNWVFPYVATVAAGSALTTTGTRLIPWVVRERCTISQLGVRITTQATGNCIFAIYASNSATRLPTGTPLGQSAANVTTGSVGNVASSLTSPVALEPGLYWLAIQCDNTTAIFQAHANAFAPICALIGGTQATISTNGTTAGTHLLATSTYGTWPDLTSASLTLTSTTAFAFIQVLIASVP